MPNLTPRRVVRETAPSSEIRGRIKVLKETNEDLRTHVQLTDEMIAGLALVRDGTRQYADYLLEGYDECGLDTMPPTVPIVKQVGAGIDKLLTAWAKRLQVEKNRVNAQIEAQEDIVRQAESGIVIPR